jgi:hypothetical protein
MKICSAVLELFHAYRQTDIAIVIGAAQGVLTYLKTNEIGIAV